MPNTGNVYVPEDDWNAQDQAQQQAVEQQAPAPLDDSYFQYGNDNFQYGGGDHTNSSGGDNSGQQQAVNDPNWINHLRVDTSNGLSNATVYYRDPDGKLVTRLLNDVNSTGHDSLLDTFSAATAAVYNNVSRAVSTPLIMSNPLQPAYGDLGKAWDAAKNVSPGQAYHANPIFNEGMDFVGEHFGASSIPGIGEALQGAAYLDSQVSKATRIAEAEGRLNFNDEKQTKEFYNRDSVANSLLTGATDAAMWAIPVIDPVWMGALAMKGARAAAVGSRFMSQAAMREAENAVYAHIVEGVPLPEDLAGRARVAMGTDGAVLPGPRVQPNTHIVNDRTVGEDVAGIVTQGVKGTVNPTTAEDIDKLTSTVRATMNGRETVLLDSGWAVDARLFDHSTGELLPGTDLAGVEGFRLTDNGRLVKTQLDASGTPYKFAANDVKPRPGESEADALERTQWTERVVPVRADPLDPGTYGIHNSTLHTGESAPHVSMGEGGNTRTYSSRPDAAAFLQDPVVQKTSNRMASAKFLANSEDEVDFLVRELYLAGSPWAKEYLKETRTALLLAQEEAQQAVRMWDNLAKGRVLQDGSERERMLLSTASEADKARMDRVLQQLKDEIDGDVAALTPGDRSLFASGYTPYTYSNSRAARASNAVLNKTGIAKAVGFGKAGKAGEAIRYQRVLNRADVFYFTPKGAPGSVVGVAQRAWDELPNGILPVKGLDQVDAHAAVQSVVRDVPAYTQSPKGKMIAGRKRAITWWDGQHMTGGDRMRWVINEYIRRTQLGQSADVAFKDAAEWFNEHVWRDTLSANGISGSVFDDVIEHYQKNLRAEELFQQDMFKKRQFGHTLDENGNYVPIEDRILAGHLDNHVMVTDFRHLQQILETPAFMEAYQKPGSLRPGDLSRAKRLETRRAIVGGVAKGGDAIMDVWKPLVLARPLSYPLRNVGIEAQSRLAATLGVGNYVSLIFKGGGRDTKAAKIAGEVADTAERDALEMRNAVHEDKGWHLVRIMDSDLSAPAVRNVAERSKAAHDEVARLSKMLDEGPGEHIVMDFGEHPGVMHRFAQEKGATDIAPTRAVELDERTTVVNPARVDQYIQQIAEGKGFDSPIIIGVDPSGVARVIDGKHRIIAAQATGMPHVPIRVVLDRSGQGPKLKGLQAKKLAERLEAEPGQMRTPVPRRPGLPVLTPARDASHLIAHEMPPVKSLIVDNGDGWLVQRSSGMWDWVKTRKLTGGATSPKDVHIYTDPESGMKWVYKNETVGTFHSPEEFQVAMQRKREREWNKQVLRDTVPLSPEIAFPAQKWTKASNIERWIDEADGKISKTLDAGDQWVTTTERALGAAIAKANRIDAEAGGMLTQLGVLTPTPDGLSPNWWEALPNDEELRLAHAEWANALTARAQLDASAGHARELAQYMGARAEGGLWARTPKVNAGGRVSVPVGRPGHLRVGEGMETQYVNGQTFHYGGIFSGAFGDIARQAVSADDTVSNFIKSGRNAANAALRKEIPYKNKRIEHGDPAYFNALAHVANRTMRNNTSARMILSVPAEDASRVMPDYIAWVLRDPGEEASKVRQMFQINTVDDARTQFLREVDHVNGLIPNGEARNMLARGEEVNPNMLRATLAPGEHGWVPVIGDKLEGVAGWHLDSASFFGAARKVTNKVFQWIGSVPEDLFARMPLANARFNDHMVTALERATSGGEKLTLEELESLRRNAARLAVQDVRDTLYTLTRRHRALESIRLVSAFAEAQTNSLAFWSKNFVDNPDHMAILLKIAAEPERLGLWDEDGNIAIPIPTPLRSYVPNGADKFVIDPASIINIYANVENKENMIAGMFLPGPAPYISMGVSNFAQTLGGGNILNWFNTHVPGGKTITAQLLGPSGPSSQWGSLDRMLPPSIQNIWHYLDSDSNANDYVNAQKTSAFELRHLRWMLDGRKGEEPKVDDEENTKMVAGNFLLRFFTGMVSPMGGTFKDSTYQHLSNVYQMFKENYGTSKADQMMLQQFPEAVGMLASSHGKSGLSPTWDAINAMEAQKDFYAKIGKIDPAAVGMLVPYSKGFDPAAYRYEEKHKVPGSEETIRPKLTPEEQRKQFERDVAMRKRLLFADQLDVEKQAHGVMPGTPEAKAYKARLTAYTNQLKEQYPGFAESYSNPKWVGTGLALIREIANNSDFAKGEGNATLVQAAQNYLALRENYQAQYEQAKASFDVGYKKQHAIQDDFEAKVDNIIAGDERFHRIVKGYMYMDNLSVPNTAGDR